jgi:hypothetical protein
MITRSVLVTRIQARMGETSSCFGASASDEAGGGAGTVLGSNQPLSSDTSATLAPAKPCWRASVHRLLAKPVQTGKLWTEHRHVSGRRARSRDVDLIDHGCQRSSFASYPGS